MNFIFECSTRYLTRSLYSLVRFRVELGKIKFISTSGHVMFCLLYEHTNDNIFDNFPKISDHFLKFSKIFQNCSGGKTNFSKHFLDIFRRFPKATKDFQGGTDNVSIIQQHI